VSDTTGVRRQCSAVGKDSGAAGSASWPSLVAGPGLVARARHLGVGRSLALRLLADARAHAGRDRLAAVGRKLGVVRGPAEPLLQSSEDACDEASIRPSESVLDEAIVRRAPAPAARSGSVTARRSGTPPLWARVLRRPTGPGRERLPGRASCRLSRTDGSVERIELVRLIQSTCARLPMRRAIPTATSSISHTS
jgi:hypothetical protein